MSGAAGPSLFGYLVVTGGYWAFTLTDGAIRMLVVLYFHGLGYSPMEVALLFLFYEFFGVVTNLTGGWLGARIGLNRTMHIGMLLQVLALAMLTVPDAWLTVPYVMAAQALSGIAKDLNKMSAKASVKLLVADSGSSRLLRWVAVLTGSKNALKGAGFFLGAVLLEFAGFRAAMGGMSAALFLVFVVTLLALQKNLGHSSSKPKFTRVFSPLPAVNQLASARFFLFASRDVWFVVALPVFMSEVLGMSVLQTGVWMATWIIGYGAAQAASPWILQRRSTSSAPGGRAARLWAVVLMGIPGLIAMLLTAGVAPQLAVVLGLLVFGLVFAVNSALHSFLVLAYAEDEVAMNVGFYYTANAAGRLAGTLLSGLMYQWAGLAGCLWVATGLLLLAVVASLPLPELKEAGQESRHSS